MAVNAEEHQLGRRGGGDPEMPRRGDHQDAAGPQAGRMGASGVGELVSRRV